MNQQKITTLFTELIKIKNQLNLSQKELEGENANLFEKLIYTENSILKTFGLPNTNEFIEIIQKTETKGDVESTITHLKEIAASYLINSPELDSKLLEIAKELQLSYLAILPELKILTHTYSIYIYNEILLKNKDSTENILTEFNKIKDNSDLLNKIGILSEVKSYQNHPLYFELKNEDLNYFEKFIQENKL